MHKKTKLLCAGLFAVLLGVGISAKANAQVVYTDSSCGLMPDYYTSVSSPVVIGNPYYGAGYGLGYGLGYGSLYGGCERPRFVGLNTIGGCGIF
jgi:hypothetical protein